MQIMSEYAKELIDILMANNWNEPTKEQFPTYLKVYKANGRDAHAPYFEDIHFVWRNKPVKY